ncbi:uncharacterized protein LOC115734518 isoform X1 [Rhodamnia argentea]|uniref:Uncharacterized protein LOC115734518 isoform X1 n=1 Tax=Rhodamnia argentea TaxID=178133 RepID=A0A8B8NFG6_9MYRT|nr:uncharacterized protein LOC115734518 isoform X1 [Rhodamnia argentea]
MCAAGMVLVFISVVWLVDHPVVRGYASWYPYEYIQHSVRQFEQKTDRFWEFDEQTNRWVEVQLPYDLVTCANDNCTKVGSLDRRSHGEERWERQSHDPEQSETSAKDDRGEAADGSSMVLPLRKRLSVTKMSETSIWITGESGSIYERFWNGVQWVLAPHDFATPAGRAISVFIINHTILALSEAGQLCQMQLSESSQPIWVEVPVKFNSSSSQEKEKASITQIKSGVVSFDGMSVYFCTKNGALLELSDIEPPRWVNHGRPPGANVALITDAGALRPEAVFIISSKGDLYEYDKSSKPPWKKHIMKQGREEDASLTVARGCTLLGMNGDHSASVFLLTKAGDLVERRIHQQKWKWISHGSPNNHNLTSMTLVLQHEFSENMYSLFFTTSSGSVVEYRIPKHSEVVQKPPMDVWANHMHPMHGKAARGISGVQLQIGRVIFALDDGRLAELHLPGLGGENSGPGQPNIRKKPSSKYVWSVFDAPESEGWNAEYCTEERGPANCVTGTKDEPNDSGTTSMVTRRRKASATQESYLLPGTSEGTNVQQHTFPDDRMNANFRLRVMHGSRSFFLITDGGLTFEYLYADNIWFWLQHDHPTAMKVVLGNYNGSLFLADIYKSLLMRERSSNELTWVNCTAMRKGRQVRAGPPWDGIPGRESKLTVDDALFFVSKSGRLMQFTVFMRKFKWKDCRNPPNTKVSCIIDQELFRRNIVFVVGTDGRLYQYNKVTELWHEHYQSRHLLLSGSPGTVMRPSSVSLEGSIFVLSRDGGLVEYQWSTVNGWNWVEHGTPHKAVTLVCPPGPCFEGNQLFVIGSDGDVYMRYTEETTWKWKSFGHPYIGNTASEDHRETKASGAHDAICIPKDTNAGAEKEPTQFDDLDRNCDTKVAPTRPIPFSDDSVIFELKDGRLAEMRRVGEADWAWSRIIGTPTSLCVANYWTAMAS